MPQTLMTSLVQKYLLNETSGNALSHFSVIGNDLTDTNTVGGSTTNPGNLSRSRDLEASALEYFTASNGAYATCGDDPATWLIWVRFESLSGDQVIISKWNTSANREYELLYYHTITKWRWQISTSGSGIAVSVDSDITPVINTWYLVIVDHDPVTNRVSIQINDGAQIFAAHSGGIRVGSSLFRLGARSTTGVYFDGLMTNMLRYDRVLLGVERSKLYNAGGGLATIYVPGDALDEWSNTSAQLVSLVADADDANYSALPSYNNAGTNAPIGYGTVSNGISLRMQIAETIPQGAHIQAASLVLVSSSSISDAGWSATVRFEQATNPSRPSSYADISGRTYTSAGATFTSGLEVSGTQYSFDVKTPLQELVDSRTLTAGEYVHLTFYDNGSTTGTLRRAVARDTSAVTGPKLEVAYYLNTLTDSVNLTGAASLFSASAEYDLPTRSATATLTGQASTLAASVEFDQPVYSATVSLEGKATALAASAEFDSPVYSSTTTLVGAASLLASSAEFDQPVYSASATLVGTSSLLEADAEHDLPEYSAGATLVGAASLLDADAEHDLPVYSAAAALVGAASLLSADVEHDLPEYAASVELVGTASLLEASVENDAPGQDATALLVGKASLLEATAEHDLPGYSASAALIGSGSLLEASAESENPSGTAATASLTGAPSLLEATVSLSYEYLVTASLVGAASHLSVIVDFDSGDEPTGRLICVCDIYIGVLHAASRVGIANLHSFSADLPRIIDPNTVVDTTTLHLAESETNPCDSSCS